MNALLVLNDSPHGTERSYSGLRLARALVRAEETRVQVFLLSDGVICGMAGQQKPDGHDSTARLLSVLISSGAEVRACSSSLDARGISESDLVIGIERSGAAALAEWTMGADLVLVF